MQQTTVHCDRTPTGHAVSAQRGVPRIQALMRWGGARQGRELHLPGVDDGGWPGGTICCGQTKRDEQDNGHDGVDADGNQKQVHAGSLLHT